jgi:hypothetical protein
MSRLIRKVYQARATNIGDKKYKKQLRKRIEKPGEVFDA